LLQEPTADTGESARRALESIAEIESNWRGSP
jgi:hypothetical protein